MAMLGVIEAQRLNKEVHAESKKDKHSMCFSSLRIDMTDAEVAIKTRELTSPEEWENECAFGIHLRDIALDRLSNKRLDAMLLEIRHWDNTFRQKPASLFILVRNPYIVWGDQAVIHYVIALTVNLVEALHVRAYTPNVLRSFWRMENMPDWAREELYKGAGHVELRETPWHYTNKEANREAYRRQTQQWQEEEQRTGRPRPPLDTRSH